MPITSFIIFIAATLELVVGFCVWLQGRKERLSQLFALLVFITAYWVVSNPLMALEPWDFWVKNSYAAGVLVAPTALIWILNLVRKEVKKQHYFFICFPAGILFFLTYFTNFIIEDTQKGLIGSFKGTFGIFYPVYSGYSLAIIFYMLYLLFAYFKKSTDAQRLQLRYVIFGVSSFAIVVSIVSFILPLFGITTLVSFDSPSSIIFIIAMGYAIAKHHLFNIRVIATELLVFAIWIFTLIRLLLSVTSHERFINGGFLILLIFFGFLLIRSVLKEVRQREEIQKLSEFKTELLSIVAHQIKNPLVVIKGYASLVEDKTICDAEAVSDVFKKIKAAAGKLVMLLNNLLDLHHLEEGKMHYEFQKLELNRFLKDIIDGFQIFARQKNLDLIFESSPAEVYVDGDTYKLSQVFQNLIDNAIKYTDKGYVKISVESKEKAIIAVSDSGQGMSRDTTQRLFQKFSRGAGEVIHGSGLGLYISKEIVEAHQGKIRAESDGEGKGSKLLVELPKAK